MRKSALRSEVAAVVADVVPDQRNQLLVTHSYRAMVTARMMAIAAGHEDADDLDALRYDPALMLACNRQPEGGRGIPSQPTISPGERPRRPHALPDRHRLHRLPCRSYTSCRRHASPRTMASARLCAAQCLSRPTRHFGRSFAREAKGVVSWLPSDQ